MIKPLSIDGAWLYVPRLFPDDRGVFLESYRESELVDAVGHSLHVAQANVSVSRRGTLRGIHFADVPPGQAKYVTCVSGAVLDVIVDIRVGSPTFRSWEAVELNDSDRTAVYVSEGLGHAFMALTPSATVHYLCSTPYNAARERGLHPLDPQLGLPWADDVTPLLSEKDAAAPTLRDAIDADLLPQYATCRQLYEARAAHG